MIALGSCARRGVPTGGPKDTIPPVLIEMNPELETVNFDEDQLTLEFNEFIQARSLKQDLIVNPPIEDYDFFVNRRSLVIEFNEELQKNTTYTFNFRDAIKDISEQNPAENVVMAFSTGSKIDSFQVQGNVKMLFTNQPAEDVLVALYPEADTLTPFEDPPTYLTKTDEEGNYIIKYIRVGTYLVYAYVDDNNNLKIDPNSESFGFESDPVVLLPEEVGLDSPTDSLAVDSTVFQTKRLYGKTVDLRLFRQDTRPIIIQSSRANGKYYEVKTNKSVADFKLVTDPSDLEDSTLQYTDSLSFDLPADTNRYIYSNFQDEQKTIRIYNTLRQDSLQAFLYLNDSLDQTLEDTLYIQFQETRREKASMSQSIITDSKITDSIQIELTFDKPITRINTDSILLSYDTLFYIPLQYDSLFSWNKRLDQVTINRAIKRNSILDTLQVYLRNNDSIAFVTTQQKKQLYLDSLKSTNDVEIRLEYISTLARMIQSDTLSKWSDSLNVLENQEQQTLIINNIADTLSIDAEYQPQIYSREDLLSSPKPLVLYIAAGSFKSVEGDSSQQIIQQYAFKQPEEFGTITGTVSTQYDNYTIQLLNTDYDIVDEIPAAGESYTFPLIPPGEYKIRVLIDEDNNGTWDMANILQNREAEPIYYYTEEEVIELRANWQREVDLTF